MCYDQGRSNLATPAEVAARLAPYLQAGAQQLNITGCVPPGQHAIALAGQIKAELLC